MSEVIVWMEMPTGCPHCPMADDDSRFCKATKKYIPMLCKPSWCPIKSVLPDEHGDLIDKDEMHKKILLWKSTATDTITICFLYHIEKLLMAERPIIAAERKDDEQIH